MHVENFLSEEMSQQIFSYAVESKDKYTPSLVGGRANSDPRRDEKFRISHVLNDLGPFHSVLHQKIHDFYPEMLAGLKMADIRVGENIELELAAHGHGAFYKPHIDLQLGATEHRVLSAVYYMHGSPKGFSGGELRIFPMKIMSGNDVPIVIAPKHNSLLVFPSYVLHEVLPVVCPGAAFKDYRFAVNCWVYKE